MEQNQLPSELRNLSPDQLQAAIEFAKNNPEAKKAKAKAFVPKADMGQPKSDVVRPDAVLARAIKNMPEGHVDPKIRQAAANLESSDMLKVLSEDGKVANPARLLENVLNLAQKNSESNQDTAYSA